MNDELAKIAYEAYRAQTGGKSLATGQEIPTWENLAPVIQEAWQASTTAVAKKIDEAAQRDIDRGNPIEGAHHRALKKLGGI